MPDDREIIYLSDETYGDEVIEIFSSGPVPPKNLNNKIHVGAAISTMSPSKSSQVPSGSSSPVINLTSKPVIPALVRGSKSDISHSLQSPVKGHNTEISTGNFQLLSSSQTPSQRSVPGDLSSPQNAPDSNPPSQRSIPPDSPTPQNSPSPFFRPQLMSSPVAHASDSIIDSPFSFNSKAKSVLDISNWLSSDADLVIEEEEDSQGPASKRKKNEPTLLTHHLSDHKYTAKELRDVNRVSRKREELLGEMRLQVASCVEINKEYLSEVFEGKATHFISDLPIIYWERLSKAVYDSTTDTFIPCQPHYTVEKNMVLLYQAEEFFDLVNSDKLQEEIDTSVEVLRNLGVRSTKIPIIVVLQGYDQYLQKLKTAENQKYRSQVLTSMGDTTSPQKKKRRSKYDDITMTPKELEYLFNKTQLQLGINVFPLRSSEECIDWLQTFTYTISYALYDKFERNESLANLGSVKSGSDIRGTIVQSLRQFKLMTEPKAERVQQQFRSMYGIYKEFERSGTLGKDSNGKNVLPPTTDGAMKRAFLSNDPNEVIFE